MRGAVLRNTFHSHDFLPKPSKTDHRVIVFFDDFGLRTFCLAD